MKRYKVFDSISQAEQTITVGESIAIEADGQRICLARTESGFFAIQDSCPHLGHSLSEGKINYLGEIVCPWHSYRYNLATGLECESRSGEAGTYKVSIGVDGLFVEV